MQESIGALRLSVNGIFNQRFATMGVSNVMEEGESGSVHGDREGRHYYIRKSCKKFVV